MTEKEIAILFGEIKKVVADFNPKYFMSDDTNSFFNGFIQVFHNSSAKKLLCYWHVLQAIKRNCMSKLKQVKLELERRIYSFPIVFVVERASPVNPFILCYCQYEI